jgi:hypothetical protein
MEANHIERGRLFKIYFAFDVMTLLIVGGKNDLCDTPHIIADKLGI